jgi:hypothetical protein
MVMMNIKVIHCATLAILATVGCSAGHDDEWNDENSASVPSDTPAVSESDSEGADKELARLEFDDGNVVRFEELNGGVLVSELGSELNPRRLVPREGMTALDAFAALAPGREVPARLLQMHQRMHTYRDALTVEPVHSATDAEYDSDLQPGGDFEQLFPASTVLANLCNFPAGSRNYKHTNRTDAHVDVSLDVNSAFMAVAADSGTLNAQLCVGKNEGGIFDGDCSGKSLVLPGQQSANFYDGGPLDCSESCFLGSCVEVCVRKLRRIEVVFEHVSGALNFHDCAQITE